MEFDIESARLAILCGTGKVVTRSEKEVSITRIEPNDRTYPLYGRLDSKSHELTWTVEGKYFADERESEYDLFIDPIFDI